jgi:hypothetical protein
LFYSFLARAVSFDVATCRWRSCPAKSLANWQNEAKQGRPGREGFHLVLETIERIQELAKQNQTHPLVLFFPMKEEV